MGVTNLGRVQGGGIYYADYTPSDAENSMRLGRVWLKPNTVKALIGDHVVMADGSLWEIEDFTEGDIDVVLVLARKTSIRGKTGETGAQGEPGIGCSINGVPTALDFTSNPQSQLNDLKQQNTNQSSQIESLGQADQSLQSQIDTKADKFEIVYDKNNTNLAYGFPNGITSGQTLTAQGICTQIRNMDIVFVDTNQGKAILNVQDMDYGVNYAGASFTMTNGGNAAITAQLYIWLFGTDEIRYIKETAYDIKQDYTLAPINLPITIYRIYGGKLL